MLTAILRRYRLYSLKKMAKQYRQWLDNFKGKTDFEINANGGHDLVRHVALTRDLLKKAERDINSLEIKKKEGV